MGQGVNKYRLRERENDGGGETREHSPHLALKKGKRLQRLGQEDLGAPCEQREN